MILGIVAQKQCGKSITTDYLKEKYNFATYAFGDPLKHALLHLFKFTEKQLWGTSEDKETVDPRWGISPRRAMEMIGTDLFQFAIHDHLKPDEMQMVGKRKFWVNRFKIWYDEEIQKNSNLKIIFSDVRFPHEAEAIKEIGGILWKIERPSNKSTSDAKSETESKNIICDCTLINDSSLQSLYDKIETRYLIDTNQNT